MLCCKFILNLLFKFKSKPFLSIINLENTKVYSKNIVKIVEGN